MQSASAALRSLFGLLDAALAAAEALQSDAAVQGAMGSLSAELALLNADMLPTQAAAAGFAGSSAFAVGRWTGEDSGEAIALDVPYDEFARHQASYSAAFTAGVADCLNVTADTVEVTAFQRSSVGTVVVFFAVILQTATSTSSAVVSQNFVNIESLFEASAASPLPGGTPALPPLIRALNSFGLNVSGAYYNDQLPIPPPSPHPPPPYSPPSPAPPMPLTANFACGLHSVEGLGHLPLAQPISGRRQLLTGHEHRRRLLACNSGCLAPKLDPAAVASATTALELKFASPFTSCGADSSGYAIAYGVCVALGCNYRNVTARYVTGNLDSTDVVYAVTFFALPGSANLTLYPAALAYALPSTSPTTAGTLAYGIATGGAIGGLAGVFLGYGGLIAPPSPPPAPPLPPSYYACTCTGGWSGADCNTPPAA